jgi:hypothetical protein
MSGQNDQKIEATAPNRKVLGRPRFSLKSLLIAVAGIPILLALAVLFFAYLFLGTGAVWAPWSRPTELRELLGNLSIPDRLAVSNIDVYCLKNSLDKEYVWKFSCSRETFDKIVAENQLHEVSRKRIQPSFFNVPVKWWAVRSTSNSIFVSSTTSPGVLMMYDIDQGTAYGHLYRDF